MPRRAKLRLLAALAAVVSVLVVLGVIYRHELTGWASANQSKYVHKRSVLGQEAGGVTCLAFSPDGAILASGSYQLRLWDVKKGTALTTLLPEGSPIRSLCFSSDGKLL